MVVEEDNIDNILLSTNRAACSFGWACSLLDREEVLLAGLV